MATVVCKTCEKEFAIKPYRIKEDGNYCSRLCLESDKRRVLQCETCGKEFVRVAGDLKRVGHGRFCSKTCMYRSKGERLATTCAQCGTLFVRKASQVNKYQNPCCSRKCTTLLKQQLYAGENNPNWRGGQETRLCTYCGTPITRDPGDFTRREGRVYCNTKCKGRWISENWRGPDHPAWNGGYEPYYGPTWPGQRRKARQRDNYTCQFPRCGITEDELGHELDVHHIQRFKSFNGDYEQANHLDNLISLCPKHHKQAERNPSILNR